MLYNQEGKMAASFSLLVSLILIAPLCTARHTHPELDYVTGSGDSESISPTSPSVSVWVPNTTPDDTETSRNGTSTSMNILDGIVDFFKEYMLLIIVVGSLVLLLIFIVCTAVIVRQKHKASAYYPSSFPKKKYVDENDKAGGAKIFSEVPEKAPDTSMEEPIDCSKQLQADILAAAQSLKSPTKSIANGEGMKTGEKPRENEGKTPDVEMKGKAEDSPTGQTCSPQEETLSAKEAAVQGITEETVVPDQPKEEPLSTHTESESIHEETSPAAENVNAFNDSTTTASNSTAETSPNEKQDPSAPTSQETCEAVPLDVQ
ncbi:transmembrane protein 119 [Rhinatrema bivittatum]|uniref:transmembrane protein 119 n=1 Tax=Rhinatrema bivittatum TaxID=194408 RepID=UPI001128818C|nr:transmembrane protein 119 [Rhinatrema bivittatum]